MGKGGSSCNDRPNLSLDTPGEIALQLPQEKSGFKITERGDLTLVVPSKLKHEWEEHERPYRSVILDKNGKVVSSGFPKFGNLGEPSFVDHQAILNTALESDKEIWMTEKFDGSLAIRSVIDGKVVFRTRGTFDGGPFAEPMRRIAEERYPALLDPKMEPDKSLLFEFVSPDPEFRIVIRYEQDDLVLLGSVDHDDLALANRKEIETLAEAYNLNMVNTTTLPNDIDALVEQVSEWEDREGVVVRCNEGQVLIKVKALPYLALHRLQSHLTAKNIRQHCEAHGVQKVEDFQKIIFDMGGDWEMVKDAGPLVEQYLEGKRQSTAELHALTDRTNAAKRQYPDRKSFAVEFARHLESHERGIAFLLLDGKNEQAASAMDKITLDNCFAQAEVEDEVRSELLDA